MKVTFPHMGNIYIPLKALFDDLGVETVVPPKCSKKTMELGIKHSPEFICLPFKLILGNYLESIENGADTIIVPGGCGPCRLGYYSEVQKEILKDLGIDVEVVVLEAPDANFKEFYRKLIKIINSKNVFKVLKCFKNALNLLNKLNRFEELVLRLRPYEVNKNDFTTLYNQLILDLETSSGSKRMIDHVDEALYILKEIPINEERDDILKVGIVGEIYTVLENYTNLDIGTRLNDMGIEVHKSISSGAWFTENSFYKTFFKTEEMDPSEAAKPFIKSFIGGHGRETVGNTVLYEQKGFDGVIHLMPLGCMPEIVALSTLPEVQKEKDIPVLSLIIDEMTGEAGYITRLEAYVDLIRSRKEKSCSM